MKQNESLFEALGGIDERYICAAAPDSLHQKRRVARVKRLFLLAACLAVGASIGAALLLAAGREQPNPPAQTSSMEVLEGSTPGMVSMPDITANPDLPQSDGSSEVNGSEPSEQSEESDDTTVSEFPPEQSEEPISHPTRPDGSYSETFELRVPSVLVGSTGQEREEPPGFGLLVGQAVVTARVVKTMPDGYRDLITGEELRLFELETETVFRGDGMPKRFLFLLPAKLYTDLERYDLLLLSLEQAGVAPYVLYNVGCKAAEALDQPVFAAFSRSYEFGNVTAFTDGVFDESLWQTPSWSFGYQFGQFCLEDGTCDPIYRGATLQAVSERLREMIAENTYGSARPLFTWEQANKTALAFAEAVAAFENGVYAQELSRTYVRFRRIVNGLETDETVSYDRSTGELLHEGGGYDDVSALRLGSLYDARVAACKEEIPKPARFDPEGKQLTHFSLKGWYCSEGETVYGVIRMVWKYYEEPNMGYYDDRYEIIGGEYETLTEISREELYARFGVRNLYFDPYGGEELPWE